MFLSLVAVFVVIQFSIVATVVCLTNNMHDDELGLALAITDAESAFAHFDSSILVMI